MFTTTAEGKSDKRLEPPSPAHSLSSAAEWEAPSPVHPSMYDGRAIDSAPRALVSGTPMGSGWASSTGPSHVSATPLPSPSPTQYDHDGPTKWPPGAPQDKEVVGADGRAVADEEEVQDEEADKELDRGWYEAEEGGHAVDSSHNPFMGDEGLFQKREEQAEPHQTTLNHTKPHHTMDREGGASPHHTPPYKEQEEPHYTTPGKITADPTHLEP